MVHHGQLTKLFNFIIDSSATATPPTAVLAHPAALPSLTLDALPSSILLHRSRCTQTIFKIPSLRTECCRPPLTKPSAGIVVKTPNGGRVVLVWAEGPRAGVTSHAPSP